jgi:hypothetical protein
LAIALTFGVSAATAAAAEEVAEEPNVSALAMVTGFHRVNHKASGFEFRLLEADGSASVAWDPIALFVVVTNNGTADSEQRIWRLPRGVAHVRSLAPTSCGVDVRVDVDRIKDTLVVGTDSKLLRLCFLAEKKGLRPTLSVTEISVVAKRMSNREDRLQVSGDIVNTPRSEK